MELACTSPWKTVISIYKDLHTSGFLFRAFCWKAPFPWNLQPHHHRGVCGLDSPGPIGVVVNKHCPRSASPGSCLPPGSGQLSQRLCLDRLGWHVRVWTRRSVLTTPKSQFICSRCQLVPGSENLEFRDGQNPLI